MFNTYYFTIENDIEDTTSFEDILKLICCYVKHTLPNLKTQSHKKSDFGLRWRPKVARIINSKQIQVYDL